MTRNTKIILGVLTGLLVMCICSLAAAAAFGMAAVTRVAKYMEENMSEDPTQVSASAAAIAAFDLPAGYQPGFTMDIAGMKMVAFTRNEDSVIMFMQVPTSMQADPELMRQQMERAFQNQFNVGSSQMKVVDQIETEIMGQPATLTISEATPDNGSAQRQLTTTFNGDNGLIMLMMMGPASTWDQDEVDAFIGSIR